MRNTLRSAVALALATFLAIGPAAAELPFTGYKAVGPVAGTSSTASTDDVALYVQYVGTATTKPTIQVAAATGDIQFEVAGALDTSVACPEADDDGVIDVSDTACNTMIEVVNAINQGGSNWRAVLVDALGTDVSTDAFASLAETDTNVRIGAPIFYDTNFAGSTPVVSVLVYPPSNPADGSFFFNGPGGGLNANPFRNSTQFLSGVSEKKTSAGTIAATVVYGVFREYRGSPTSGFDLYEVIRTAWSQTGGATATQATLDFSNFPLVSTPGEAFLARIGSSTTISVQNLNAVGVAAVRQP